MADGPIRPLEDDLTGTKVGIGLATGADGVFITKDPDAPEPDPARDDRRHKSMHSLPACRRNKLPHFNTDLDRESLFDQPAT
jgi:hypothetical protein